MYTTIAYIYSEIVVKIMKNNTETNLFLFDNV